MSPMRWTLLIVVILACGVAAWQGLAMSFRRATVRPEDADRIAFGMTLPEAQVAIGCPPGDYRRDRSMPVEPLPDDGREWHQWCWDDGEIYVGLQNGRVVGKGVKTSEPPAPPSMVETICRWLRI